MLIAFHSQKLVELILYDYDPSTLSSVLARERPSGIKTKSTLRFIICLYIIDASNTKTWVCREAIQQCNRSLVTWSQIYNSINSGDSKNACPGTLTQNFRTFVTFLVMRMTKNTIYVNNEPIRTMNTSLEACRTITSQMTWKSPKQRSKRYVRPRVVAVRKQLRAPRSRRTSLASQRHGYPTSHFYCSSTSATLLGGMTRQPRGAPRPQTRMLLGERSIFEPFSSRCSY